MSLRANFSGAFNLNKALAPQHLAYLTKFNDTRRMKRIEAMLEHEPDPVREAAGLPVGPEGAYYVGSSSFGGQDFDNPSVVDSNHPPDGQPGLWCQWKPNNDGTAIVWDGSEKIYEFAWWIEYLVRHFLGPWGYLANGTVTWETKPYPFASEVSFRSAPAISRGDIVITDNEIEIRNEKLEWL